MIQIQIICDKHNNMIVVILSDNIAAKAHKGFHHVEFRKLDVFMKTK